MINLAEQVPVETVYIGIFSILIIIGIGLGITEFYKRKRNNV